MGYLRADKVMRGFAVFDQVNGCGGEEDFHVTSPSPVQCWEGGLYAIIFLPPSVEPVRPTRHANTALLLVSLSTLERLRE